MSANVDVEKKDLVEIQSVSKRFNISGDLLDQLKFSGGKLTRHKQYVHAVNDVSLTVRKGEALCVVGESGCGKSTLARVVIGLLNPSAGQIVFDGKRIDDMSSQDRKPYHRRMQMIFQNPYASLNPRMTIRQTLEEPLQWHQPDLSEQQRSEKIAEVMDSVGIDASWGIRHPHEFSGGQRQRISIARALIVDPEFIVADEPISALDVSIQAQVLNLMMKAQEERHLTYLFITHDLAVVEHFATRVAVMYLGTLCELATASELFQSPQHPYTRALLSAIPRLQDERPEFIRLEGEVPTPVNLPSGCVFHGRCPHVNERCRIEVPLLMSPRMPERPSDSPAAGSSSDHEPTVLEASAPQRQVACHAIEEGRI